MGIALNVQGRVLSSSAAAKRLQIPERTLRHRARRGRIPGAFKEGKLWKFPVSALALMAAALAWPAAKDDPIRLADYKGKVVLLNFWATTCGGCRVEIPWFMEFEKKYKRDGLEVIGVALDEEGWKVVQPFVSEKKMNYRVVIGDDALAAKWKVEALPMTVLVGRDGKVVSIRPGMVDKAACEKEIVSLLHSHTK
jgi:cytochrome c biogenesis protein CcmG/thiol:disulfide interchange protein DsbE